MLDVLPNEGFTLDTFGKWDQNKINVTKYGFFTEASKDINPKLIKYAETVIHRYVTIYKLNNLLFDHKLSTEIEKSVFEFALIHVTLNNLIYKFILAVYNDKLNDILENLDLNINKTLKPSLLDNSLKPNWVAFLSPDQINPANWADILQKRKFRVEAETQMATSDHYKCRKCGERKCRIIEMQTRSADEPTSLIITCVVCFTTFVKC